MIENWLELGVLSTSNKDRQYALYIHGGSELKLIENSFQRYLVKSSLI